MMFLYWVKSSSSLLVYLGRAQRVVSIRFKPNVNLLHLHKFDLLETILNKPPNSLFDIRAIFSKLPLRKGCFIYRALAPLLWQ